MTDGWLLRYEGWSATQEPLRESLCALANGRFATRAAAPESTADGVHYPGTYAAGVFDRLADEVDGVRVENESLVNLPAWPFLTWRCQDGDWLDLAAVVVTGYVQELDLRRGVLSRRFTVTDAAGRRTRVGQRWFVSMGDPCLAALDCTLVPENWAGRLTVRSGVDGRVTNAGVARYRGLSGEHLLVERAGETEDGLVLLEATTRQSRIGIAVAARHRLLLDGEPADCDRAPAGLDRVAAVDLTVEVAAGRRVTVEKVVALVTSRDRAISEPAEAARGALHAAPDLDGVLSRHVLAWDHLWRRCDVGIDGPEPTALVLRLHLFHLLQTVTKHSTDLDAGVPARGLTGEAYRGHVFWDEVFVLPFLALRLPHVARAMLLYRWRRLPQARAAARALGRRGAAFPWQSGSSGCEESPSLHLNPRSGHWLPDRSSLQRHIGLAVAYNTWRYHEATEDIDFLDRHGAEMILDVATFWADTAAYDPVDDRYDLCGVMGPDEYHDGLPWRDTPGVDDNSYTNVMAAWVLTRALECLERLPPLRRGELLDDLGLRTADLERWDHVSRRLRLCWHPDADGGAVLSQFRDWDRLEEFDWAGYRARYGDIRRLDRILEAEGDTPNRYRLSKQADVLMLFHLLTADEFYEVLDRLGYPHDRRTIPRTVAYHLDRTCHGSTLSELVHAWVLARSDRRRAWQYFLDALESDIADVQGGTTPEGIHLGAMAGTVDLLQRGFTGLETRGDVLGLDPCLPDALTGLRFRIHYRRHPDIAVTVTHDSVTVGGGAPRAAPLPVRIRDGDHLLAPGATLDVALPRLRAGRPGGRR